MGRPLNKRYFGTGAGNQIKTRFQLDGTEYNGYIVSQRSTNRYLVSDGTHTGICTLVDKADDSLADNEMNVEVLLDDGTFARATKIYSRVAIVGGAKVSWNFDANSTDSAARMDEEAGTMVFITLTSGLSDTLLDLSDDADDAVAFSVTASATGGATISYAWAYKDVGGDWTAIVGATTNAYTTDALTTAETGRQYRVVMTATGAAPVESIATVTVQA
jgi:hypothetical protein